MAEFTCPKCNAHNRPAPGQIGCLACGFGRPHEHKELPRQPKQVEAPPGYKGKYLTEIL